MGSMIDWKYLLAYSTGTVDPELLLRNEYLATENRLICGQLTGRLRLTNGERETLAEIGQKLGKLAAVSASLPALCHRYVDAEALSSRPLRAFCG
jgi:hypothetical protein